MRQHIYVRSLEWAAELAQRLHHDGYGAQQPDQLIVNEDEPSQGIAGHVDCIPCFDDTILSISLGSACVMMFTHTRSAGAGAPSGGVGKLGGHARCGPLCLEAWYPIPQERRVSGSKDCARAACVPHPFDVCSEPHEALSASVRSARVICPLPFAADDQGTGRRREGSQTYPHYWDAPRAKGRLPAIITS